MSEKIEIVNGELKITKTPESTISTMTREEVVGKKAEAQTEVDHLEINLAAKQVEVTKWENYLIAMGE